MMEGVVQNAWYMAGWEDDLAAGRFGCRIADIPIVVFRDAEGPIGALHDRCPHRFARLSLGTLSADGVVCPYHGLAFDVAGKCTKNPFADRIPPGSDLRAFAARAKDQILWVWLGDPATADDSLIPDFSYAVDNETTRVLRGRSRLAAHYEYVTDNLMDLSHIEWVHGATFGGRGICFFGKHQLKQDGDAIDSNWWIENVPTPPIPTLPDLPQQQVDMWMDLRWQAPSSMHLRIGVTPVGQNRDAGREMRQIHMATPIDSKTTMYFWAAVRHERLYSAAEDDRLRHILEAALGAEDKLIIEDSYAGSQGADFWSLKPVSLKVDEGGVRARRLIEAMALREKAPARQGLEA